MAPDATRSFLGEGLLDTLFTGSAKLLLDNVDDVVNVVASAVVTGFD